MGGFSPIINQNNPVNQITGPSPVLSVGTPNLANAAMQQQGVNTPMVGWNPNSAQMTPQVKFFFLILKY